jgi:Ser/Thr protein kinase RdoA (MazF antagonist)
MNDPARDFTRWFAVDGECVQVAPLKRGHIHDTLVGTWRTAAGTRRVVHQRVNTNVFRDPSVLMQTWLRVTEHVRATLARAATPDLERRCLRAIPARSGAPFHTDEGGAVWRAFPFIEGARSFDVPDSPTRAQEAARAFGAFAAQLRDLDPATVAESIPHFHDFPHRFAALETAAAADAHARARGAEDVVARARRLAGEVQSALAGAGAGALPLRVVHNDCKLNNVLFDEVTGEALCVIDLDTVMPGSVLADFGDLARTAACPAPEDETDLAHVQVDARLYEALVRGYLAGAGALLAPVEIALLPLAGPLIALETGIRFLTDHLAGDVYFRIHRPAHNLDRARVQLRLTEQLLARVAEARGMVERGAREARGLVEVGR